LLLAWPDLTYRTGCAVPSSRYFGFPPAPEEVIQATESRLGVRLPPSLRSFYGVSNGWRVVGFFIYAVRPVQEIGWLKDLDPSLFSVAQQAIDITQPFKKDPDGKRREEYRFEQGFTVRRSVIVTSDGDASTWLLDPLLSDGRGEWRAGQWSSWNPAMDWFAKDFEELFSSEVDFLENSLKEERS
jgi:hypothetical protein